jgi:hypothetical protein
MATVKCKYCGEQFDKEKEPYIQIPAGSRFRHAHAKCYIAAKENKTETGEY